MTARLAAAAAAALFALAATATARAATVDFAIDVTSAAGTLSEDTDGTPFILDLGVDYLITISGILKFSRQENLFADAEYFGRTTAFKEPRDVVGTGDKAVDLGVAIDGVKLASSQRWGDFRSDHVYTTRFTGQGAQVRISFFDAPNAYGDNRDSTLRAAIERAEGAGGTGAGVVPLPAGLPLLAGGLGLLALLRRRKSR